MSCCYVGAAHAAVHVRTSCCAVTRLAERTWLPCQAEFLARREVPAAKATRISRKPAHPQPGPQDADAIAAAAAAKPAVCGATASARSGIEEPNDDESFEGGGQSLPTTAMTACVLRLCKDVFALLADSAVDPLQQQP